MFCWNAAYYRDYEDAKAAQVVGDEYEGTRTRGRDYTAL